MDYYQCDVFDERSNQNLSSNEIDLEIRPIWLKKSEIMNINKAYEDSIGKSDVWVEMVLYVLESLDGKNEKALFESERCYFTPLQVSDYDALKSLFMNPQVRKYLGGPVEDQSFDKKFKAMLRGDDKGHYYLVKKRRDCEFVGLISLDPHQDGLGYEISYQFLDDFWSMGYGRESVKRLIEYAFEDLGFESLVAETQSLNKASCRLLESLGMKLVSQVDRYQANQNIYLLKR
jgi:ribosomal-protein-alanine N-acetyltransferase